MSRQLDIFGGGEARSFAPHLDPACVEGMRVRMDEDCDHVGSGEVGKFGNNVICFVFEVLGPCEVVLYAEQCTTMRAAEELKEHHEALLEAHKQRELW